MGADFITSICCGLAGMQGWTHATKPDGSHLWWWKDRTFALGIVVWPDVGGAPIYTWKVKRLADGNEVEGACSSIAAGTQAAVITHERWVAHDAHHAKPKREPRWLPAADEPVPF